MFLANLSEDMMVEDKTRNDMKNAVEECKLNLERVMQKHNLPEEDVDNHPSMQLCNHMMEEVEKTNFLDKIKDYYTEHVRNEKQILETVWDEYKMMVNMEKIGEVSVLLSKIGIKDRNQKITAIIKDDKTSQRLLKTLKQS